MTADVKAHQAGTLQASGTVQARGTLQARTRRTRAAVIEAARTLFVEQGYVATTMDAISRLSDTPQATVYRLFGSKLGILSALLDVSVGGDDQPVAMAERPSVQTMLADPDPRNQLAAFASVVRHVMARAEPVHRILTDAARSDPAAAELMTDMARQRREGQRLVARSLTRSRALRSGLKERDASDVIHALASPEVYRLLVLDRGWSLDRYEAWLADCLVSQLLPPRAGADG